MSMARNSNTAIAQPPTRRTRQIDIPFPQVTDADYPGNTCRGTAYLDGRVFVMAPNGDIYQSADGDFTSWNALEFIGADIEPDKGMYLAKWNSYIMALKAYSPVSSTMTQRTRRLHSEPRRKHGVSGWVRICRFGQGSGGVRGVVGADQKRTGRAIHISDDAPGSAGHFHAIRGSGVDP